MRKKITACFIHGSLLVLFISPCNPTSVHCAEASSEENEALFVRRILEFWRDKENAIVKSQIDQFVAQYPQSQYVDSLLVVLGDVYWNEKNYESALKTYRDIHNPQYQEKVFNNTLDCLYHLGCFREVHQKLEGKVQVELEQVMDEQQALWTYYRAEALLNLAKQNIPSAEGVNQLELAKHHFQKLLGSRHKTNARLGLTEIESLKGNAEQVVHYYLELAEEAPDKKDEMLLRAAHVQAQYDPEKALVELERIQGLYGEFSSDAAMKRLSLLFERERYRQIIDEEDGFYKAMKTSQHPILHLYVGRSYFHLNNYGDALLHLQKLQKPENSLPELDPAIEMSVLVMMGASAYHLHKLEDIQALRQKFQHQFPQDPSLADILYYEAMTLAWHQKYGEAISDLEALLSNFPYYHLKEDAVFEKSVLLFKQGRWQESREGFASLIENKSKWHLSALQYMPCLSLQILEEAENRGDPDIDKYREILIGDLKTVLGSCEDLETLRKARYVLQLGKTQYEAQHYHEAIETLNRFIENYPGDENLFQGHLLLALCYHEGIKDPARFAEQGETVLRIKPDFVDSSRLHLNLFNAYIELANNSSSSEPLYDKAAEHLFSALQNPKESIRHENLLWLANHFYQKIKKSQQDYETEPLSSPELIAWARKSLAIYESALNKEIKFNEDSLNFEIEYFKWSNLYGWMDKLLDQQKILAFLMQAQNAQPQWNWKLRSRVLYSQANLNRILGRREEALNTYKNLFTSLKSSDPYIFNASKLQWTRLAFEALPVSKRKIEDPEMVGILKALKDVQIHKILEQEPIHLEAGMDYAGIRASLEPEEKRKEQQLFLLNRMKEDFNARDDLWSKEYFESRQSHPEKNALFERYMILADAHIRRLQGKAEEARNLYQQLISGNNASSNYLVIQAKSGLQQIDALNVE